MSEKKKEFSSVKLKGEWKPDMDFYKRALRGISASEPISQMLCFSATAAPGMAFAAHELGATANIFLDARVTDHAMSHGQEILKTGLLHTFLIEEFESVWNSGIVRL